MLWFILLLSVNLFSRFCAKFKFVTSLFLKKINCSPENVRIKILIFFVVIIDHEKTIIDGTDFTLVKVANGWKPGAVSKVLLKKLGNAKLRMSVVDEIKRTKRIKKRVENKPTLKIKKVDGKYQVEMQVASESPDESNNQYSPIVFKIENNEKTSKKIKEKLVAAVATATTSKSDLCKEFCFKAYNDAIGFPIDRNVSDEDAISECSSNEESVCSSSHLDFEIHFSPPIVKYKASQKQPM